MMHCYMYHNRFNGGTCCSEVSYLSRLNYHDVVITNEQKMKCNNSDVKSNRSVTVDCVLNIEQLLQYIL